MKKKPAESDLSLANDHNDLAHDLKNDLAILTGCCELLGDTLTTEAQVKDIRTMRLAIDRMRNRLDATVCRSSVTRTNIA